MPQNWDDPLDVTNASLAAGIIAGTAAGAVKQGELTILTEAGVLRRAHPALPLSALNNTTVGPSPLYAPAQISVANGTFGIPVRLTGGNIVIPSTNVQTSPQAPGAFIRGPAGGAVALISTGVTPNFGGSTQAHPPLVAALANGNFVLTYLNASSDLKADIYTPNGTLVTSVTVASAIGVGALKGNLWGVATLTGGSIALAYQRGGGGGGTLRLRILTSTGAPGAEIDTGWGSGAASRFVMAACAGGDVLVGAYNGVNQHALFRYAASGAFVYGPTLFNTGSALDPAATPNQASVLIELPNGKTAWVIRGADAGAPDLFILNAAGAITATVDLGSTTMVGTKQPPIAITPYGLAVVGSPLDSPTTYLSVYDFDGGVIFKERLVDAAGLAGGSTGTRELIYDIGWAGTGLAIVRAMFSEASNAKQIRLILSDLTGAVVGAPINVVAENFTGAVITAASVQVDGLAYLASNGTFAAYKCARTAIAGVAQTDAADGADLTVAGIGSFPLLVSQVFPLTGGFDNRASVVPGPRGFIGSNRVFLFGFGTIGL